MTFWRVIHDNLCHLFNCYFTYPNHYFLFYVVHDVIPVFRIIGRILRDQLLQVTGLDTRRDPPGVDAILWQNVHAWLRGLWSRCRLYQVVHDVVDHLPTPLPELKAVHLDSPSTLTRQTQLKIKEKLYLHLFKLHSVEHEFASSDFASERHRYDHDWMSFFRIDWSETKTPISM